MPHYFAPIDLKQSLNHIGSKNLLPDGKTPLDKIINDDDKILQISSKCLSATYKFSPYSLKLFLKGKGEAPREICVPSLIDQAVLKSLDKSLKEDCKITNATDLAFFVIQEVRNNIVKMPSETMVLRLDIKKYFDSINHEKLLNRIDSKSCPNWMRGLVERAIKTPAKEPHKKTPPANPIGVPQGLSIANHLADLYLESFETVLKKYSAFSYRYVDDILIFFFPEQEEDLLQYISEGLGHLGLELHTNDTSKFYKGSLFSQEGFDFLGYHFLITNDHCKISVRDSSIQKFLNSAIGLIKKYQKGGYNSRFPDTREAEIAFTFDLNEKITGAYKENRRYGWLWYFRQVNDLGLLQKMDKIIEKEMKKDETTKHLKIKRLKRAHYEITNFTPKNKYILNYGLKDVVLIKKYFGRFDRRIREGTDEAALAAFQFWTNGRLKRLMLDEVKAS